MYLLSYKLINNVSSMRTLFINNAQGTASFSFIGFIKSSFLVCYFYMLACLFLIQTNFK